MSAGDFDLGRLLQPLSTEQFFAESWEKQPLLLPRHAPDHFASLLTEADLENLISNADLRYPAIQLSKGGGYLPPELYTRALQHGEETFSGVANMAKISELYRQGATVSLPAIHRTWAPLGRLCEALQTQLDHAAHANVYITPGNAAGFTPHYDTHEVFVLQIAGHKRWSLYAPPLDLPHRSQPFNPTVYTATAPVQQIDLKAGDLLYLPRGHVHSTSTSASHSAHITIGISVYTWADLAKEYLQACIDSPRWRQALPPGFASHGELTPLLRRTMLELLDEVRGAADHDRLLESFKHRVRLNRIKRPEPFRADVSVIDLQSRLQVPASDHRITQEGTNTVLEFEGQRHMLPAPVHSTLESMVQSASFRTADLPGPMSADAKLGLSRYLYNIGFLVTAQL
jgi:ribosomal protein L16 Arg81 hydroxylase